MQPNAETDSELRSETSPEFSSNNETASSPSAKGASLISRLRSTLQALFELAVECTSAEPEIESTFETRNQKIEREFDGEYQAAIVRFASDKEVLETEIEAARRTITECYATETKQTLKEFAVNRRRIVEQFQDAREAAKSEYQESRWTISAVHEGTKSGTENTIKEAHEQVDRFGAHCRSIRAKAEDFLEECRLAADSPVEANTKAATIADFDPVHLVQQQLDLAETKLRELRSLRIPRYFRGEKLLWIMVVVWILSLYPAWLAAGWFYGLLASTFGVSLIGLCVVAWLRAVAKAQVRRVTQPLYLALARAAGLLDACREEATFRYHEQLGEGTRKYQNELRQVTQKYRKQREDLKEQRSLELTQISDAFRAQRAASKERRARDWKAAVEKYRRERKSVHVKFHRISHQLHEILERELSEAKVRSDAAWEAVEERWREGLGRVEDELKVISAECGQVSPGWNERSWEQWRPADSIPPVIRFGEFEVRMAEILEGIPATSRIRAVPPKDWRLPALMPFPTFCSMLVKAHEDGRSLATQVFQTVMLRLLAAIPPGKLRFTIIDPVGLGRNFASFMHLADYDEVLVTSRIWTEMAHIDQKLADLTEHMETVIQKYLRDQFPTLEDYNVHAQEVAEPYRFLVVANFPLNFSPDAIRRLASIIQSGPRCGVYTLISVDTSQPLPAGFSYSDLEQPGTIRLDWQHDRFKWQDEAFVEFPLTLDTPPAADFSAALLRLVGEEAKLAKRVEVPFEFVAPPPGKWWMASSKGGIDVPLGRVGATKRQHLSLGHGTSQHVLIAGKTGSGKSTFLHALVSNLALYYSPEEMELYLIDFKKGVEFKTYANHELPHARVIAIESEREFGLSVLQRLDQELKRRAELFRATAAQDLASYRNDETVLPLPRILLVVDEFQEFFVEDDKIAQDASLLLDRLVRQGRAFGLHVLLGSQTLGGAYTLARSTIDQMAVRIALQCSETDAHLILSHDNSAARLLSRPGEAIYNDANGLIEGNNPFQIVWLSDERREFYLEKIQELARHRPPTAAQPQVVFEGNAPANVDKNTELNRLLSEPAGNTVSGALTAWLGEAIAIKDPTAATFVRQSGSNLLIVGQNDTAALGMMSTAMVGLAAQLKTLPAWEAAMSQFYVLDGTPKDVPYAGYLIKVAGALGPKCKIGGRRELPAVVAELAAELNRRLQENIPESPAIFLMVYGLQRFRDLRRPEDDFGFSAQTQEKPSPASQFSEILREGPALGIHVVAWCDSLNNVTRALDRQSLREFELRVLFQMSANDSSTLIDSALASRLGVHRAFFCSEEQGKVEKFRPYGPPSSEWLHRVYEVFGQPEATPAPAADHDQQGQPRQDAATDFPDSQDELAESTNIGEA
jgi:hypothetical protein